MRWSADTSLLRLGESCGWRFFFFSILVTAISQGRLGEMSSNLGKDVHLESRTNCLVFGVQRSNIKVARWHFCEHSDTWIITPLSDAVGSFSSLVWFHSPWLYCWLYLLGTKINSDKFSSHSSTRSSAAAKGPDISFRRWKEVKIDVRLQEAQLQMKVTVIYFAGTFSSGHSIHKKIYIYLFHAASKVILKAMSAVELSPLTPNDRSSSVRSVSSAQFSVSWSQSNPDAKEILKVEQSEEMPAARPQKTVRPQTLPCLGSQKAAQGWETACIDHNRSFKLTFVRLKERSWKEFNWFSLFSVVWKVWIHNCAGLHHCFTGPHHPLSREVFMASFHLVMRQVFLFFFPKLILSACARSSEWDGW